MSHALLPLAALLAAVAPSTAHADDLDDAVSVERAHRAENATAATATGGLLAYDSFRLIYDTATGPSGRDGLIDTTFFRDAAYFVGGMAGAGSITMIVLGVHDLTFSPVADARAAYRRGDGAAIAADPVAAYLHKRRYFFWGHGVLGAGLLGAGVYELAKGEHGIGMANLYIGGSMFAFDATLLLHSRQIEGVDVGTLSVGVSPHGLMVAGRF
jgi:hypothetical protein